MVLAATVVLTSTVSADGSIGGVYAAGLQLAERTAGQTKSINNELKQLQEQPPPPPAPKTQKNGADQSQEPSSTKPDGDAHGQKNGKRS